MRTAGSPVRVLLHRYMVRYRSRGAMAKNVGQVDLQSGGWYPTLRRVLRSRATGMGSRMFVPLDSRLRRVCTVCYVLLEATTKEGGLSDGRKESGAEPERSSRSITSPPYQPDHSCTCLTSTLCIVRRRNDRAHIGTGTVNCPSHSTSSSLARRSQFYSSKTSSFLTYGRDPLTRRLTSRCPR